MNRNQVSNAISPLDAWYLMDMDPPENGKVCCPIHEEKTPSLHFYDNTFYCFGCGEGGDSIWLVAKTRNIPIWKAIKFLERSLDEDPKDEKRVKKEVKYSDFSTTIKDIRTDWSEDHDRMVSESWPYLEPNDVEWYVIPTKTGFAIPYLLDGQCVGIKYRTFDGRKYAEPGSVFTYGLYRPPLLESNKENTLILEGESDLWCAQLAIDQSRMPISTAALPAGSQSWKAVWASDLHNVLIATDSDEPGQLAAEKIQRDTGGVIFKFNGVKDIAELCSSGRAMELVHFIQDNI